MRPLCIILKYQCINILMNLNNMKEIQNKNVCILWLMYVMYVCIIILFSCFMPLWSMSILNTEWFLIHDVTETFVNTQMNISLYLCVHNIQQILGEYCWSMQIKLLAQLTGQKHKKFKLLSKNTLKIEIKAQFGS